MWVFGCAWKINFQENIFNWPCVLMALTWKWFEVKIFTSNHFWTHVQKERERSHPNHATNPKPRALRLRKLWLRCFLNLIKYNFDFDFESHPDRTLRLHRRIQSPNHATNPEPRSRLQHCRDRTPGSHRDCTNRTDHTPGSHRDGTNRTEIAPQDCIEIAPISLFPDLVPPSSVDTDLSLTIPSFFSQFDQIWWIFFFVGFCFCVYLLRNGIIYLFGSWENVRNKKKMCFYIIFSNTTDRKSVV